MASLAHTLVPIEAARGIRNDRTIQPRCHQHTHASPDGEPSVAFRVAFHPPVKPEGMLKLEALLGLGGTLLFQPSQNRLVCFFRLFLLDPVTAIQTDHFGSGHELC